jgi:hypothetical protein
LGVYVDDASSVKKFRWVKAPTNREINQLSHVIAHRLAWYLERQGLLEKDVEHRYLTLDVWMKNRWINCGEIRSPIALP